MTNPQDLTGRDLDLAVTKALGYVWWHDPPCLELRRADDPPPSESPLRRTSSPVDYTVFDLPGYDHDGARIPELFAAIVASTSDGRIELVRMPSGDRGDFYSANCFLGAPTAPPPTRRWRGCC